MSNCDFRLLPLVKRYNDYIEDDEYIIPCNLLEISDTRRGNKIVIKIERLDFLTGELIISEGITYEKCLEYLIGLPILTTCKVRRNGLGGYELIVYSTLDNPCLLLRLQGEKIKDEITLMEKFNSNYLELNKWLNISDNPINKEHDDLPF